jgi:hypothetical protein
MRKLLLLLLLPIGMWGQLNVTLARWNFNGFVGGAGLWQSSPQSPTASNSNVNIGGLTRGFGVVATGSSANNAWGGTDFQNTSQANAITNGDFFTLTFEAKSGTKMSLTEISAHNIRRSGTGPGNAIWQYQIGAGAFTDIGTSFTLPTTTAAGNARAAVSLSSIGGLQNLNNGTVITLRLVAWGGSAAAGTFYINNPNSTDTFQVKGITECIDQSVVGTSKSGLTEQCIDNWTYYGDVTGTRFFAINKNGNTFTATPSITVGSTIVKTSSNGANQEHGMWLMGRYWDATLASGSIGTSVSVRFYYDPADTLSAFNARDAAFTALPGTTLARKNPRGEWFKTPNGTVFNSAYIGTIIGNKFPTGGVLKPTTVTGTQNGVNYVEYQGLTGFSGGTIGFSFGPNNGGGANGLPVTWAGFDASVQRDYTELIWHTASEQNTSHFEVEASLDGKSFKTISENIAAAGNSASLLSYSFRDMDLAPIKYYRLKQVDIEGTFEYSKIIVAKRSEGEKQDFDMLVYPVSETNNRQYHLLLKNKIEDISAVQIVDYTGKPVFKATSSKNAELLDLTYLTPGIYMIQVWNGEEKQVERVVVQ